MRRKQLVISALAVFVIACQDDDPITGPSQQPQLNAVITSAQTADDRTPFQLSVMRSVAERQAAGLPVPTVKYEYVAAQAARSLQQQPAGQTVIAKTIIEFTNPEQAGMTQWPAVVVSGDVPANATGFVRAGDYTETIKEEIRRRRPDSNVDYETGPRTYTISEKMVLGPASDPASAVAVQLDNLNAITASNELLMGFTVLGPNVDYHLEYDLSICVFWFFGCAAEVELVNFWAGYKMDWTIGIRLPMALEVNTSNAALEGSVIPARTTATGVDWDAADFERVGVSGEDGKEFLLKFIFKVGLFVEVVEVDVVDLGVDIELDSASSFATPLGPGAMFALPSLDVSIWGYDLGVVDADVGVALTPMIGSDRFTANWNATAEGSGAGTTLYSHSGVNVALGNVAALDGPGNAAIELTDMKYYFTQFALGLGLYFDLYVLGYGGRWNVPITDFDLGGLMGGLFLNPHAGTANALTLSIPIANVPPTVTLSHAGTVGVNGTPTFLTYAGQTVSFTGTASDPGRDDITLVWNWDADPSETSFYSLPHAVTESKTHTFNGACLYQVTLTATDDDQASGQDDVSVVAIGSANNRARSEGYWQHQLGRMGATDFTNNELQCLLKVVGHMSQVFGELRDVSTFAAAHNVVLLKQNGGSELEQLDRELMVAWLNYANGALGNGNPLGSEAFRALMAEAESVRTNPVATTAALHRVAQLLHRIRATAD